MTLLKIGVALLATFPVFANAQTSVTSTSVKEDELRACLVLEQEGLEQFKQLEQRASELKGTEQLLTERRNVLQKRQTAMSQKKPGASEVEEFNNMVNVFNEQSDQLNVDKAQFEIDVRENENWMRTKLDPVCAKIESKPVAPITSYYACGFDTEQPLSEAPHCKSLPNKADLKACIDKAGSKSKAMEICSG